MNDVTVGRRVVIGVGNPYRGDDGIGPAVIDWLRRLEPSGAEPRGAEPSGAEPSGAEPSGAEPSGAEPRGAEPSGAGPRGAEPPTVGSGGAGLAGVVLAECDGDPAALMDLWSGAELAVVVDAVRTRDPVPGRIHRRHVDRPAAGPATSHSVDLGETVALAAVLGRLPGTLVFLGVEAGDTAPGHGLTPEVAAALPGLVDEIMAQVTERPTSP